MGGAAAAARAPVLAPVLVAPDVEGVTDLAELACAEAQDAVQAIDASIERMRAREEQAGVEASNTTQAV